MSVTLSDAYHNFEITVPNQKSLRNHKGRLKRFMEYCQEDNYDALLYSGDIKLIQTRVCDFLIHIQSSGNLSAMTIRYYAYTLKSFYEMNDIITLNWRKINKVMTERKKAANDRPYTTEEISRLLQVVDQRGRIIILLMASSGMREGAIHSILLSHIERIQNVYKIVVYKNSPEEYITFCSPECAKAIDDYLSYRKRYGEILKPFSPLIRKQFEKDNHEQAANPKEITFGVVRGIIYRAIYDAGIREKKNVVKGEKKILHEVMQSHGLRKFFNTNVIMGGMSVLTAEMLMGHHDGLAMRSYVKPTVTQMLDEYMKVVDSVTIAEENKLRRQVSELEQEKTYWIKVREEIDQIKAAIGK